MNKVPLFFLLLKGKDSPLIQAPLTINVKSLPRQRPGVYETASIINGLQSNILEHNYSGNCRSRYCALVYSEENINASILTANWKRNQTNFRDL